MTPPKIAKIQIAKFCYDCRMLVFNTQANKREL
jgi:hypothetical protein